MAKITFEQIEQALVRGYQTDRNKDKEIDINLMYDQATEIEKLLNKETK